MKLPDHLDSTDFAKVCTPEIESELDWIDFNRMLRKLVNRDWHNKHWTSQEKRYQLAAQVLDVLPNYKHLPLDRCIRVIAMRYYLPSKNCRNPGIPPTPAEEDRQYFDPTQANY